ncbi:MAG: TonB-dependent receptor, partial [Spongiibacteraceae bacterium]|nr:TonB-dependent receptor [Spongiibacteraceae bacterium]
LSDQWSVGLGVSYNYLEGELSRTAPHPAIPGGPDVRSRVTGDDSASWGYNVGVLFQPVEGTRIGLSYRSEVDYGLEGKTTLQIPGLGTQRFDAALDVTLPAIADLSITQQLNERWTLYATAMWTEWSRFDELVVENRGFTNVVEPQEWQDTWLFSVGASVQLSPTWMLRAGIGTDETPTRDEHRSVRVPNGDRLLLGLGASWTPSDEMSADLGYMFIKEEEVNVGRGTAYQADFQTDIHIVALQVNYRF